MSKVPQGHRQTVIICIATPHLKLLNINNATPFKLNNLEKVYITPPTIHGGLFHPQTIKQDILLLNFPKAVK